ncbi:Gamma-interferon-inducible lysosomal thiol reductase [Brachionus plicatilis]|uniref:Gamma-interferon-inducible lysosomal thiol reductase n=1 Tax=Brachionus plicatilis TaxID=10195 RepID=A0A3M7RRR8_BRAPC|nr:Gamma-interferon-inducible lysosomal thiol reductase [Brachionus plicatilis]
MKIFKKISLSLVFIVLIIYLVSSLNLNSYSNRNLDKILFIDVFYETRCPDSADFLRQIGNLKSKIFKNVYITLVSFGKASYTWDDDSKKWNFHCQHGPQECYGNTIHNCLIDQKPKFEDHFPFLACTMENLMESFETAALYCAKKHSIDYEGLKKCANDVKGNRLLHEAGEKTNKLDPKLNYIPWINVNGVHTNEIQQLAERNLTYFICSQLKVLFKIECNWN